MSDNRIKLRDDNYQLYHPFILNKLSNKTRDLKRTHKSITLDFQRAAFIFEREPCFGRRVLDIGANQGYMSVEAALRGAEKVDAFESNEIDYVFMRKIKDRFSEIKAINPHNESYKFSLENRKNDYVLCLNVLHHIGRYFDFHIKDISEAKLAISHYLSLLIPDQGGVWLQIGYNWKGEEDKPLFEFGTKAEVVNFIKDSIHIAARIKAIGIYNPESGVYENVGVDDFQSPLWVRNEFLGEFGNRPLFYIESIK